VEEVNHEKEEALTAFVQDSDEAKSEFWTLELLAD
jgi:hypothetical protein